MVWYRFIGVELYTICEVEFHIKLLQGKEAYSKTQGRPKLLRDDSFFYTIVTLGRE